MSCIENHVVRAVVALDESASCAEAARVMAEHGIGSVGVRRGAKLVGIVTERDLLGAVAGGLDPARTALARALPCEPPSVPLGASERQAAEAMRTHRTRHLAVTDRGEIVGVLSLLDLVAMVDEEKQWAIDQLECYIRGGRAQQLSSPIRPVFAHAPGQVEVETAH